MSLDSVFQQAIAAMDSVTKSVQETIRIRPWIGEDLFGRRQFGATRKYKAVVDRNASEIRTQTGRVIQIKAAISFLVPVQPIGAVGRQEPIDPRDEIYCVDDLTGPIVGIRGSTNQPSTTIRYFQHVFLG